MAVQLVRSFTQDTNVPIIVHLPVQASTTIQKDTLVQIDATSRKLEPATEASQTIVGIAMQDYTTGAQVTDADSIPVALVRGWVIRIPFITSGTKKDFSDTDRYLTAFDLEDEDSIDPDDTTGGMCYVQAYDNNAKTVDVIIGAANLANVG